MREIEKSAGSVEEAIEAALEELGASEQEVEVEVIQEPRGGFLGLGSQQAQVRVRLRSDRLEEDTEELDDQADVAMDFLEGLFDAMGLPAELESNLDEGTMYVDVWASDSEESMGLLIGRHGQTLEALQDLVRSAVQRKTGDRCRVVVDVEDYRKRRRSQLVSRAQTAARRVKKSGKPESLEPMNAFERKIVHDAAAEVGGVETASEGQDPDRRVVIRRRHDARVSRETAE
ncbi:MAG: protein jag [Actinomycetota bacterium]|nr:protein jag [Actinomycetota bacterium]